jgi:DsbC/DsbD-like thiol-disulfide interchange protein
VNVASISYDSQQALSAFAKAYDIKYPLLSDKGSLVIRRFNILNTNVPADVTRFYGIPFPGEYLLSADGDVKEKIFLPDYQERPAASAILLRDFGATGSETAAVVKTENVTATVIVSDAHSYSGQQLGIAVDFAIASGWHIYGTPLPSAYTPAEVIFDGDIITSQQLVFPNAAPVEFKAMGETLPVYTGKFRTAGQILLKQKLPPGEHKLAGTVQFQECSESECRIPQQLRFELPLRIDPMAPAAAQARKPA